MKNQPSPRQPSRLPPIALSHVGLPLAVLGLIVALALGFLLGRASVSPTAPAAQDSSSAKFPSPTQPYPSTQAPSSEASFLNLLSGIPDVRQSSGYSCGAAALQAILAYWGTSEREDRLIARLRSTPEQGTHPADIVRVAREFGLSADLREGLALSDLESALSRGTTVIVDLQAWRDSAEPPWPDRWDDGHYMVLLGMDAHNLYFEDPSLLGSRGFIPVPEFLDRWHDYEGEAPLDDSDRKYVRMAIFIRGKTPSPPPSLEKVE
jgi:predicted double-glycine peptidase